MTQDIVKAESGSQGIDADRDQSQYLTFLLGSEMFAIDILNIREIIEYGQITEVPMMPAFVRGVINLRGSVVPVIDLQVRFGRGTTEVGKRTCIVIVEVTAEESQQTIGVVVDAVSEVLGIPEQDIEKAPSFGANIRQDFIQGMGKVDNKFIIILNVGRVLSVEELAQLSEAKNLEDPEGGLGQEVE